MKAANEIDWDKANDEIDAAWEALITEYSHLTQDQRYEAAENIERAGLDMVLAGEWTWRDAVGACLEGTSEQYKND